MKFNVDNYPQQQKHSSRNDELTDTIAEEHPKHFIAVAEQQIMAMHHHSDGSPVELHQVGSQEFIQQSIRTSLEGKLGDVSSDFDSGSTGRNESNQNNLAAAKIEYEKKSSQGQQQQLYGAQHSVTGAGAAARHETAMVGCNCGVEWTVTGQSTKAQGAESVKIEQYGPGGAGQPGGYRASGAGGEKQEYRTGAGQQQDYKG